MITLAKAKINLGLKVIRKRQDGFHDIETLMYPIGLSDILEIIPAHDLSFDFSNTGIQIDGDPQNNLCVKAYYLMKHRYDLPDVVKIHLHKVIPPGAGLGGGSSDAAHVLKLMQRIFSIKMCNNELHELAAMLGSDCSFFIHSKPVLAQGCGDILTPVDLSLAGYHLLLVTPPIMVSTSSAYHKVVPSGEVLPEINYHECDVTSWNSLLTNDFEEIIMKEYPEVRQLRDRIMEMGASYAAMSGSGPTVFGLFKDVPKLHADDFKDMFVWQEMLPDLFF